MNHTYFRETLSIRFPEFTASMTDNPISRTLMAVGSGKLLECPHNAEVLHILR